MFAKKEEIENIVFFRLSVRLFIRSSVSAFYPNPYNTVYRKMLGLTCLNKFLCMYVYVYRQSRSKPTLSILTSIG